MGANARTQRTELDTQYPKNGDFIHNGEIRWRVNGQKIVLDAWYAKNDDDVHIMKQNGGGANVWTQRTLLDDYVHYMEIE